MFLRSQKSQNGSNDDLRASGVVLKSILGRNASSYQMFSMRSSIFVRRSVLDRKREAVKIYIYLRFWAAEHQLWWNKRETDGPANVTGMFGKLEFYLSNVVNNNKLEPDDVIKKGGQSHDARQMTHMRRTSQSAICGLKNCGCIFILPDFYLSSSADFTVLPICSRSIRSWNITVGSKMLWAEETKTQRLLQGVLRLPV